MAGGSAAIEIQQLRHLLAAVQHGNLLKAAEASHITQSGLSRSITSLEQRLGVPLLIRTSKGVEPTIYGLSLIQRARVIINEAARAVDEIRAIEAGNLGEVSLGITQNYASYLMPALLTELQRGRPEIRFKVETGGFLELVERLEAGAVDVVFGLFGTLPETDDLVVERLRDHYSRVIARASHPLARARSVSVEALAASRWATLSGEGFQRNFAGFFAHRQVAAPVQALRTDSIDLIRRFVLDADVLTVLPADAVREDIRAGSLVILDCETPAEWTHLGLITRVGGLITPQVRLIADRIRLIIAGSAKTVLEPEKAR